MLSGIHQTKHINMKRFEFNKLIRNKIAARMIEEGVTIYGKTLNKEEFCKQLRCKLLEEAEEVSQTTEVSELIIELADVLEVIDAFIAVHQISPRDIENARLKKRDVNGYFDHENYIDYIEVPESNSKLLKYLLDKYRPYEYKDT